MFGILDRGDRCWRVPTIMTPTKMELMYGKGSNMLIRTRLMDDME